MNKDKLAHVLMGLLIGWFLGKTRIAMVVIFFSCLSAAFVAAFWHMEVEELKKRYKTDMQIMHNGCKND